MKIQFIFWSVLGLVLCSQIAHSSNRCTESIQRRLIGSHDQNKINWRDQKLWNDSILHSNDFYIRFGWDDKSGSFASEISGDGHVLNATRHLISTSRMIYGLAWGSLINQSYLNFAQRQADFLLNKMMTSDSYGSFFKSSVDDQGLPQSVQTQLIVNEQAYGLNGLVALYKVTLNPDLLTKIESLYQSFYNRFHDSKHLGFFDSFDFETGTSVKTKSFNSTVYVATSFLIELAELPGIRNRNSYLQTLVELADQVAQYFYDSKTGWIVENFTEDWQPQWRGWQKQIVATPQGQREFTIGVTGHNFQAAWLLLRVSGFPGIPEMAMQKYRDVALKIISSMLSSNAVDRIYGGVFDSFKREDGENMWHMNKAWWQQAEAILALTLAEKVNLFTEPEQNLEARRVRDQILDFYFLHFIDPVKGGEFPVVQRDGRPVLTENKGQLGTGTYHQVELARFMKQYSTQ